MTAVPAAGARAPIAEVFASVPLLSRLSERQRGRLARLATTRSYRAGAIVVQEGDTSMALYVVLSGTVRIDRKAEGGEAVEIARAGRGGFFGEMGLLDDQPRSATVTALEATECALLAKWDFQNELRDDPDIAIALLPVLSQRIRDMAAQLAQARTA